MSHGQTSGAPSDQGGESEGSRVGRAGSVAPSVRRQIDGADRDLQLDMPCTHLHAAALGPDGMRRTPRRLATCPPDEVALEERRAPPRGVTG